MSTTPHADKRSVSTDALETLGTIIGPGEARDAIHLAVEPVVAGERLKPSEDVGLGPDGKAYSPETGLTFPGCRQVKALGIVDPFLKAPVKAGEMFWLVVYPRQIRSLRHVWEHPDFPPSVPAPVPVAVPRGAFASRAPTADEREKIADFERDMERERAVQRSKRWIEEFAANVRLTYDEVMGGAEGYIKYGDMLCFGPLLEGESVPDEFWTHFEVITGESVDEGRRGSFFTCSC